VAPNVWLTSHHNLKSTFEFHCSIDSYAPQHLYKLLNSFKILTPLTQPLSRAELPTIYEHSEPSFSLADLEPMACIPWPTKADFTFLKTLDSTSTATHEVTTDEFLIPDATPLIEGEALFLISYHQRPLQSTLLEVYSEPFPNVSQVDELFVQFETKSVSPGQVLKVGSSGGIFCHDCTCGYGSTGGLIIRKDQHGNYLGFVGIHLGSWSDKETNYNVGLSVRHPYFVQEYLKNVYPLIPKGMSVEISAALQSFISNTKHHHGL